jgi:hypothetical protein
MSKPYLLEFTDEIVPPPRSGLPGFLIRVFLTKDIERLDCLGLDSIASQRMQGQQHRPLEIKRGLIGHVLLLAKDSSKTPITSNPFKEGQFLDINVPCFRGKLLIEMVANGRILVKTEGPFFTTADLRGEEEKQLDAHLMEKQA